MLQFSSAYMISDSLFYVLLFTPSDVMFIVHHTISLLYVVGVVQSGHGAISAVVMYFLGEITSPLLNGLTFAETLHAGLRSRKAQVVHRYLSTLFTASFILIRTFVGLPTIAWFLYSLVWRSPAIHAGWRALMGVCVAIGMLGSQAWTVKLMAGLFRQWRLHLAIRAKAA
ncbi:hypothetical protein H632_c140p1 [Helicosporidium sp. ATCC 50920]|nr:hypothetical protein H632_c140p1 [Helicosporidium sp. ATCC 50920]|eukprot:KDD76680.1 hypothetical protein H632_c140p1 [Helicosporidium sp. ATCC 50920]